jgi:hypothetical protein
LRRALLIALLAAAALPALAAADAPPLATISSGPPDPSKSSTASFMFTANVSDARFACALDSEPFRNCTSPLTRSGIPDGRHTLFVIAIKDRTQQKVPSYWTWTVDTTPPGPVAAQASIGYRRFGLTWTPSADTDHVVILRSTSEKQVNGAQVYSGPAHRYHERKFNNGGYHRYTIVSFDKAGNSSAPVVQEVKASALLSAPLDGAQLRHPHALSFRWHRIAGARYYNIQLFRGTHKVLSTWPLRARFRLNASWAYHGHHYKLKRGRYTWYVWPSMRPLPQVGYGPIVGQSSFVVR